MCGIAGVFRINAATEEQEVLALTDSLRHRGPDGYGIKMFGEGGIGHRRLSIIDLATGAQPISNEDGTIWITFNGEIYNFSGLRDQLKAAGHLFKTNSDTEVIVHGYEQWGFDVLKRLRGMFAFALVDMKKKIIFAARDHFGIKPFYYRLNGNSFAFASELQAFRALKDFDPTPDLNAVDQYLWLQYIPAPRTIWKNTFKLKPAHYIIHHIGGKTEDPVCYWDIDFRKKEKRSEAEWIEKCEEVISDSVKAHLVSDVPFGAFLSGGIDSTLVVNYMSGILREPVKTFSIGFEEQEYNELTYAEIAAKEFGTEHHVEIVRPDALAILPQLIKHYGEPYGDSSAIPTYYVCQLARKHVTMVLSGDGGDEAFAGYHSYMNWLKYQAINYRSGWRKKVFPYVQQIFPSKYPRTDTLNDWIGKIEYIPNDVRMTLWKKEYAGYFHSTSGELSELFASAEKLSLANRVQYMDMKTYMPYDILTKVDVAAMMHSLEVRTPLIDKEVWEFAATIPEDINISTSADGKERSGKMLLKKILRNRFGDSFVDRKKMGFGVPLKKWFANGGALNEMLNDTLLSHDSHILEYFDHEAVNNIIRKNSSGSLWLLLFLEQWMRENGKKAVETRPHKII